MTIFEPYLIFYVLLIGGLSFGLSMYLSRRNMSLTGSGPGTRGGRNTFISCFPGWHMNNLSEEIRKRFTSDMGFVVDYLNEGSFERRKNQKIVHAEALCEMMEALTKDTRFTDMIAKVRSRQEKGGDIIMCEYLDMLEEKGERRLASLLAKLYALGRDEDAKLAVRDEQARVRLYKELCIC